MGVGVVRVLLTHVHMHMHACTHMYTHASPIGGIPGNSLSCHMHVHMCVCVCVCVCMHVHVCGGTLSPLHIPIHPPPRGTPRISKTSIALELIKIFQFSKDLKFVETPSPMTGCKVWWVGGWVARLMGGVRSNH